MKKIEFQHAGRTHSGYGQNIDGKLWVHFQGKTFALENQVGVAKRKSNSHQSSEKHILSPMPGKITKVVAQNGNAVKPGDLLIVMEAMKMEYALKASRAGTVEEVKCKVGDQVTLGQLLVQLS